MDTINEVIEVNEQQGAGNDAGVIREVVQDLVEDLVRENIPLNNNVLPNDVLGPDDEVNRLLQEFEGDFSHILPTGPHFVQHPEPREMAVTFVTCLVMTLTMMHFYAAAYHFIVRFWS